MPPGWGGGGGCLVSLTVETDGLRSTAAVYYFNPVNLLPGGGGFLRYSWYAAGVMHLLVHIVHFQNYFLVRKMDLRNKLAS